MNEREFDRTTNRLASWYGRRLSNEQRSIMFQSLEHIPTTAYKDIVSSLIEDHKSFPTLNEIKRRFWQWKKDKPNQIIINYDPNETTEEYYGRIQTQLLYAAVLILEQEGENALQEYLHRHHINTEDEERIRNKHIAMFKPTEEVKAMQEDIKRFIKETFSPKHQIGD